MALQTPREGLCSTLKVHGMLSLIERLVLLAISHELTKVAGHAIQDEDVAEISGLVSEDLLPTLKHLEFKKFIRLEERQKLGSRWVSLIGEARESVLMPWSKRKRLMDRKQAKEKRQRKSA